MRKIAKNSELSNTSYKTTLCEDPREALIEIASGKYDAYFLQLANIYFADMYKNTNYLSLDGAQIREKFLNDFDFRKSLILFGQEKGLGIDNREIRNQMTHRMNFEGESIDDMKQKYSSQMKKMFFKKKDDPEDDEDFVKDEKPQQDDPILSLLKQEDKNKVILSRRYGGNILTFTKLSTILSLADAEEQKDIIKYLVPNSLKKEISLEGRKEIIDITGANAVYEVIRRGVDTGLESISEKENEMKRNIIAYIITKNFAKDIPLESMIDIINRESHFFRYRFDDIPASDFAKFLIEFLEGVEAQKPPVKKNVIEVLEACIRFFGKHNNIDTICLYNKKIDFALIEEGLKDNNAFPYSYEMNKGIEYLKECMKMKKGSEKALA